jgi:hypothetical protein
MTTELTGTENPLPVPPILDADADNTVPDAVAVPALVIVTDVTAPPETTIVAFGANIRVVPLTYVMFTLVYVPLVYPEPPVIVPKLAV